MQALLETLRRFDGADHADSDARRLFHGRGHCYPGLEYLAVDWYAPIVLVTLFRQAPKEEQQVLLSALEALSPSVTTILLQRRYIRGGPIEVIRGGLPQTALARERGWRFRLALGGKQNIGYFMDMSPGREWLAERCSAKRVLNLFAYTCAFSVAAMGAGAHQVVNIDMSRSALNQGRENHRLNGQESALVRDVSFLSHDIFRSWKKLRTMGPHDIVIIDPPSRQKGSFEAERDYGRVLRRLPELMPAGGDILACLNAPQLPPGFLHTQFQRECPGAVFVERLPTRADFPEADSERNLKMLHYRLQGA